MMRKNSLMTRRKLHLSTETLRRLDTAELKQVAGGLAPPHTARTYCHCETYHC